MSATSNIFTYGNLANLDIENICSANYASLRRIITTAPSEVQEKHPSLPRAVYKLLSIVLSLREKLRSPVPVNNDVSGPVNPDHDRKKLEDILALSFEEVEVLADENISELISMVQAGLRADHTIQPREFSESDPSSVTALVLKWQLQATKAALHRRDVDGDQRDALQVPIPDDPPPTPSKRKNPMDVSHDSGLVAKRQKFLRVAGVPTGEHDDDVQDFRYGLGGPAHIRPSQLKAYPGKTTALLNVQELMGP